MKQWKKSGFLKGIFLVTFFLSVFVDTVAGVWEICQSGQREAKRFFYRGGRGECFVGWKYSPF